MMSPTEPPHPPSRPSMTLRKRGGVGTNTPSLYASELTARRLNWTMTTQRSSRQSISAEQPDGWIQVIGQATADATCSAFCRRYLGGRPGTLILLPPRWVVPSWGGFRCANMLPRLLWRLRPIWSEAVQTCRTGGVDG